MHMPLIVIGVKLLYDHIMQRWPYIITYAATAWPQWAALIGRRRCSRVTCDSQMYDFKWKTGILIYNWTKWITHNCSICKKNDYASWLINVFNLCNPFIPLEDLNHIKVWFSFSCFHLNTELHPCILIRMSELISAWIAVFWDQCEIWLLSSSHSHFVKLAPLKILVLAAPVCRL